MVKFGCTHYFCRSGEGRHRGRSGFKRQRTTMEWPNFGKGGEHAAANDENEKRNMKNQKNNKGMDKYLRGDAWREVEDRQKWGRGWCGREMLWQRLGAAERKRQKEGKERQI